MFRISVDCMGGDNGLSVTLPAALNFLKKNENVSVILVGNPELLEKELNKHSFDQNFVSIVESSEVVLMDEQPVQALRRKKKSSMRIAINLVKDQLADGVVSAGNTGALMAISKFVLGTLDGIDRPAIASFLPNSKGAACMLDLGANIDSTPENLYQFAIMGSCLYANQFSKDKPSVGLLNIGSEKIKGNDTLKLAVDYLSNSNLNFYGNVEGDDIFHGKTDVVVCDGFAGNVSLKTAEGVAFMIKDFLKKEFSSSIRGKIASMLIYPELIKFKRKIDPRVYNGAALIGLNGVVFKSHGNTDILGFESAIDKAHKAIKNKLNDKIKALVLTEVKNSNVQ